MFGVIRTRHPQLRDGLVSCGHQFEVVAGIHSVRVCCLPRSCSVMGIGLCSPQYWAPGFTDILQNLNSVCELLKSKRIAAPFLPLHIEGTAARFRPDHPCPCLHCCHCHAYCLLLPHEKSVFLVAPRLQTMPQLWQKIHRKQPTKLPAPAAGAKPNRCVPLKSRLLSIDCYDGLGYLA